MGTSSDESAAGAGAEAARPRGLRGAIRAAVPGEASAERLTILSGAGQNLAGLMAFVLASFGANVLIARVVGQAGLGVVTLATQFAFIAGAATRFGMDMAAVRRVAVDVGRGEGGRIRAVVGRAAAIAGAVSVVVAGAAFAGAGVLASAFGVGGEGVDALRGATLALPFVALAQVYLGGTRGLKVMRHTLTIYWAGQPTAWIALMALSWLASRTAGASVLAYAGSWALATAAAWLVWERDSRAVADPPLPPAPGETRDLLRYGAPRAPAALLSQLLFWTDYFVLSRYVSSAQLGVYAASVRVAQALVLFLTAVNYMFSPFVADLHARGERDRLDGLYKALTRWVVAGTVPLLLLLAVAPGPALRVFGGGFVDGSTALRILLIGQAVNVAVGSVGFILIMVGRTGWDLVVYAASFALDLGVAFWLAPSFGAEGAAVAQSVTLVFANAIRLYLVWRFVRIQPFTRHYALLAVPAGAGAAVMVAVHGALRGSAWPVDLAVTAAVGGLAYLVALAAVGLTPGERRVVRRVLGRGRP